MRAVKWETSVGPRKTMTFIYRILCDICRGGCRCGVDKTSSRSVIQAIQKPVDVLAFGLTPNQTSKNWSGGKKCLEPMQCTLWRVSFRKQNFLFKFSFFQDTESFLHLVRLHHWFYPFRRDTTMALPSQSVSGILDEISSVRMAFEKSEAGSRESLIDHSRALIAALEIPSEFIQRTFWAEVRNYWNTLEVNFAGLDNLEAYLVRKADLNCMIAGPICYITPRCGRQAFSTPTGSGKCGP